MKKTTSKQLTLKKSYARVYERQISKAKTMLADRKKISNNIRKARSIFERLHNLPKFDEISKNICNLCDLLSDYVEGLYEKAPLTTIVAVLGGLLYLVLPFDVLADFIPVLGWLDDAAVLAFIVKAEQNDVGEYLAWKSQKTIIDAEKVNTTV